MSGNAARPRRIWFEVEDLLRHFDSMAQPAGIQRVSLELIESVREQAESRVGFFRLSSFTRTCETLDFPTVTRAAESARDVPSSHGVPRWAAIAANYLLRHFGTMVRDGLRGRQEERAFNRRVSPGDILVCLGAPWATPGYGRRIAEAKRARGARFALLIHDVIPLVETSLVKPAQTRQFERWFDETVPAADLILTSSHHCRGELETLIARKAWPQPAIEVVRFGAGFRTIAPAGADAASLPASFVAFVATIEIRKNHRLLVRVWERLVARHGAAAVPVLVFIGRIGWLVEDLLAELAAKRHLDGKIVILSDLTDSQVADAYDRCLFTVYPSLCEGWGLPVAESLARGRFCIASNRTSLPEVGGEFVDYFDPTDEDDALGKIERVLFEPGYLAARTQHIATHFEPPRWRDCARQLIGKLDALP